MILHSTSITFDFSHSHPPRCPCNNLTAIAFIPRTPNFPLIPFSKRRRKQVVASFGNKKNRRKFCFRACSIPSDGVIRKLSAEFSTSARRGARNFAVQQLSNELDIEELPEESTIQLGSNFSNFQEDPIVDKLRTQLGGIHPIPSPPLNRSVLGLFVFFFFVGVVFDKVWTWRKRKSATDESIRGVWPQVPTSFSLFLEKDLQRKESVEWVNMVLGKLWKVYRGAIENWIIGLLQPVIDNLSKPDYVERVEIKQFSLGDEPLSVRNVERRTSRRVNDLQYQIGLRYTGGARMLLSLSLKFGIFPIVVPFGVRNFDIDGELWVKLRLIPTEPWVGAVSWAFVSLPKIKFDLSPFRLFNLMAIPVLSMFLTKLLTKDLPKVFVRPKKIVLDFQKGMAVGPVADDLKSGEVQDGNINFVGELSVTLVDARQLSYVFSGKTDPYVILSLGDQIIRSKKNSQTTVIGPPGEPIWNQDFHMLVANPRKEKLCIQVKDSVGITDLTVGTGEVDLGSLQDTVPTDRIVELRGGWGLLRKASSGEILLRLTYKAYVEDEEDDRAGASEYTDLDVSDDELFDSDDLNVNYDEEKKYLTKRNVKEPFMDVLAALIVSEEFQGIVSSDPRNTRFPNDVPRAGSAKSPSPDVKAESKPTISDDKSRGFGGSALFWLAVITSISMLIAINLGGSSFFNP